MTNRSFDPFIMEKRIYDLEQSGGGGVPQELIDKVNKNTADITNLDGDIVDLSGDVEANTSAISTLDSRVTQNTTDIGTNTTAISTLNSNLTANSIPLVFDYQNGQYGYNTSTTRGADTFFPFKGSLEILKNILSYFNYTQTATIDETFTIEKSGKIYAFLCFTIGVNSTTMTVSLYKNGTLLTPNLQDKYTTCGTGIKNYYEIDCSVGDTLTYKFSCTLTGDNGSYRKVANIIIVE